MVLPKFTENFVDIIRGQIQRCQGYEVKTEGDAFMVAFSNTINACQFCLLVTFNLPLNVSGAGKAFGRKLA